ncbi:MAG: amidohydrolase family protein [Thiohalospira sp.]
MPLSRPRLHGLLLALVVTAGPVAAEEPLFDAHLHYHPAIAASVSAEEAGAALDGAGVEGALVLVPEAALLRRLEAASEARLLPFLDLSRRLGRKNDWMHAEDLVQRARERLDAEGAPAWRGIGELHIRAEDRFAPAFEGLLALAAERDLPLMIHGDPAVIDHAYTVEPEVRIVWAHAGTYAYPPLLDDYLTRHPNLVADLSMRNPALTDDEGHLKEAWFELLTRHADRFLVGMDTFSARRWAEYEGIVTTTRRWLDQLPPEVADALARGNAQRLFSTP